MPPQSVDFWVSMGKQLHGLIQNGFPMFPEIQKVFKENMANISRLYSKKLKISVSGQSLPGVPMGVVVPFACATEGGEPEVSIFMPCLMKMAVDMENHQASYAVHYSRLFEAAVVIRIMHELDHLALGVFAVVKPGANMQEVIDGERIVWARTCEKTTLPLVDLYKRELSLGDSLFYSAWKNGNRDSKSTCWKDFITTICKL